MKKQEVWWTVKPRELKDLSVKKALDLLVECFFHAQKETLARAKEKLGFENTDEAIRRTVTTMIDEAFKKNGGDVENPTYEVFEKVLHYLALKSKSFGHPKDIIEHHFKEMEKVLKECEKQCRHNK